MMWQDLVATLLLALGVGLLLLCCLGVLVMDNLYDRLHYLGPASTLGAFVLAVAVVLREGASTAGLKALTVAAILVSVGPVLSHAIARAARVRQFGSWEAQPGEVVEIVEVVETV